MIKRILSIIIAVLIIVNFVNAISNNETVKLQDNIKLEDVKSAEFSEMELQKLEKTELKYPHIIYLKSGNFTVTKKADPNLQAKVDVEEYAYVYIMVKGRITSQLDTLRNLGVKILTYSKEQIYAVKLPLNKLSHIQNLSFVHWIGNFDSDLKIHPVLQKILYPERKYDDNVNKNFETFINSIPNKSMEKIPIWIALFEEDTNGVYSDILKERNYIQNYSLGAKGYRTIINPNIIPEIANLEFVAFIEPSPTLTTLLDESTPTISADYIRGGSYDGSGISVQIIDTGYESSHQDLPTPTDADSYVGANPLDDNYFGHGTHVAGILLGRGNANSKYKGVATGVSDIYIDQVVDNQGQALPSDIIDAMESRTTDVASMSLGYAETACEGTDAISREVDEEVYDNKRVFVIAAGNEGLTYKIRYPGCSKNTITVGATWDEKTGSHDVDDYWDDTSGGPTGDERKKPDISAPGCDIYSADYQDNDGYVSKCGTSMATPHVSGLVTTLLDHYSFLEERPDLVKALLITNAIDRGNPNKYGAGKVDSYLAHWVLDYSDGWKWSYGGTNNVSESAYHFYNISVPDDTDKFIVTLVWNEPPADFLADSAVLNNLDLYIDKGGDLNGCYSGEENSASTVDNVERVVWDDPGEGYFKVKVCPTNISTGSSQQYGIIFLRIRGDPTPTLSVSVSASDTSVNINEDFTVTATVSPGSYVASGVYSEITLPSGVNIQSMETTREDGVTMTYGSDDDSVLGDIRWDDSRSVTWTLRAITSGAKSISVSGDGSNTQEDSDSVQVTVLKQNGESCTQDPECSSNNCVTAINSGSKYCAAAGKECSRSGYDPGYDTGDEYGAYICKGDDLGGQECNSGNACHEYGSKYCNGVNDWVTDNGGDSEGQDANCNICVVCSSGTGDTPSCSSNIAAHNQDTTGSNQCTATCKECDGSGNCANQATDNDYFSQCGAVECDDGASPSYYYGWSSLTCYYREDEVDGACNGNGNCKTASDYCPSNLQDGSSGVSCDCVEAQSDCNGTTIGSCDNNLCDAPPTVTLVSPSNNNISTTGNILFNCSATDDNDLDNITLYHNISGTWQAEETKTLTGTADYETFTINNIPDATFFIWNCLAYDNASQSDWGNTNYTTKINITEVIANMSISSLQSIYSNNTLRVFEFDIENNGNIGINNISWQLDTGDSYIINSTQNISLDSNEDVFIFAEYNYSGDGSYVVMVNATNGSVSALGTLNVEIGDLLITSFDDLDVNGLNVVFEAIVQNNLENDNITNINWSLTTDDGEIINASDLFDLEANETIFIYVQNQYSSGGTYNPSFTVSNPTYSDTKTASVTTNSQPAITAIPDIIFNEDAYNDSLDLDEYVIDAEDDDVDLTWTYSGNTNIVVNIDETTHLVNFTAIGNFSGSENIKFTVNDTSGLTDNDTILVTVNPINDAPSFNSSNPVPSLKWPEDTINSTINLTRHFYDIDNANLNFTASNTENVSIYIENITGKVNITPNANWSGIAYAIFTAIDNTGLTVSGNNLTLNVTSVNDAPTFTGDIPEWKWPEDIINISLDLTQYFSDIDGDSLKYNYTLLNNITISINNDTGIVTLTPDGNFTGVRNTIFTAIDIGNLTIPSNNVTLNVTPVNDPPTIDTFTPTELTPTIVLGNSLTFNHTSSDVDGDTLAYSWKLDSTEKSTEQGWKYTPISNEIGTHNVTLNVSDGTVAIGMQWNVSVINQSDIDVYDFSVLNQNSTVTIFGFNINNTGNSLMLGINWSLNTGQETITATNLFSLQPNESMFIFAGYNYTTTGEYTITASATNKTHTDSETIAIDVPDIEVSNVSVLNISGTKRIFEIVIENTLSTNLTNVNWTFDTKDSSVINAINNALLQPNEKLFVYLDYNFTTTGVFNVNATAKNGTLSDSRNLTIAVS